MIHDVASAETEAAALPEGWQVVRIGDAYHFTKKPKGLNLHAYSEIPFVPMELIPIGTEYFEQYELRAVGEISSGTYFEPGDILLSKITPSFENGKQGIIERLPTPFGYATTEVIPIKAVPELSDQLYLFYYLLRHSVRYTLASKMEGTTGRQRLNKSALEKLEIPLPPLAEQRAIASALRAAQGAAQARRRLAELERERKAALMQALFTKGTRGEATKATEIGEVPESWEVVPLGSVSVITTGTTPATEKSQYYNGSIPFVKTAEIANCRIVYTSARITKQAVEDYNLRLYPSGSVFVAMYGQGKTRGQVALLEVPATTTQNTAAIVPGERLDGQFLWQLLMSQYEQLRNAGSQGHISHLNLGYVKAYNIILPPLDEQRDIAEALRACDEVIAGLEREAALHEELFRALLEELMRGRVRVTT